MWSNDGPVFPEGVLLENLLQSKSSFLMLAHLQKCLELSSKSQFPILNFFLKRRSYFNQILSKVITLT